MSKITSASACALVARLLESGQTPDSIAKLLDGRVSPRTVYRWGRGETVPQNARTLEALQAVADATAPVHH